MKEISKLIVKYCFSINKYKSLFLLIGDSFIFFCILETSISTLCSNQNHINIDIIQQIW